MTNSSSVNKSLLVGCEVRSLLVCGVPMVRTIRRTQSTIHRETVEEIVREGLELKSDTTVTFRILLVYKRSFLPHLLR
jgi:hypothetical protein